MDIIKKISVYIAKYMAIIVVVVAALAFFVPLSSTWIQTSWINYLLMIVMFGMGLTTILILVRFASSSKIIFSPANYLLLTSTNFSRVSVALPDAISSFASSIPSFIESALPPM